MWKDEYGFIKEGGKSSLLKTNQKQSPQACEHVSFELQSSTSVLNLT